MVRETISHYRVERQLGRGDLGEVYLAEDLRLRRPVARAPRRRRSPHALPLAVLHALRGETEEALVNLEKAARLRRALTIARAKIEPELEGLRGEPRFRSLVSA